MTAGDYGLTEEERKHLAAKFPRIAVKSCCLVVNAGFEILGADHLGVLSQYRRTVTVRCVGCGYIRIYDLEKLLAASG